MIFIKKFVFFLIKKINFYFIHKNIVFYHIPRSSGTSIKFYFRKYCGSSSYCEINQFLTIDKTMDKDKSIFLGHMAYNNFFQNQSNVFEFTILRNPIDRYISQYYYFLNFNATKKVKTNENIIQKKKLTLIDYVELIKKKQFDNISTRIFSNKFNKEGIEERAFENENSLFKDNYIINENDLEVAINNLKNINVYILETFSIKRLIKKLNFKIFFDDFHENKSTRLNSFTEDEIEKIKSICEFDIMIYKHFIKSDLSNKY